MNNLSSTTEQILFDMESVLCDKINTDKIAQTHSEMQAYNRGIAEGMRLIRERLDAQNEVSLHLLNQMLASNR